MRICKIPNLSVQTINLALLLYWEKNLPIQTWEIAVFQNALFQELPNRSSARSSGNLTVREQSRLNRAEEKKWCCLRLWELGSPKLGGWDEKRVECRVSTGFSRCLPCLTLVPPCWVVHSFRRKPHPELPASLFFLESCPFIEASIWSHLLVVGKICKPWKELSGTAVDDKTG